MDIELAIIRLEAKNEQLKKMLKSFERTLSQEEVDEILDEIGKNTALIRILQQAMKG